MAEAREHIHAWRWRQNVTSKGDRMPAIEVCADPNCDAARYWDDPAPVVPDSTDALLCDACDKAYPAEQVASTDGRTLLCFDCRAVEVVSDVLHRRPGCDHHTGGPAECDSRAMTAVAALRDAGLLAALPTPEPVTNPLIALAEDIEFVQAWHARDWMEPTGDATREREAQVMAIIAKWRYRPWPDSDFTTQIPMPMYADTAVSLRHLAQHYRSVVRPTEGGSSPDVVDVPERIARYVEATAVALSPSGYKAGIASAVRLIRRWRPEADR